MNEVNLIAFSADEIIISKKELKARLKLPDDGFSEEIKKTIKRIEAISERKCAYSVFDFSISENNRVDFGSCFTESVSLSKYLEPYDRCVFFAATLGMMVERFISSLAEISVTERFLADAVASAYIESVCDKLQFVIGERFGHVKGRFSPGYGDFDISFQHKLLDLIDANKRLGISLIDSMLMIPRKSVSGIIGVKNEE